MLSEVSRSRKITIIGGSIPERSGDKLYNSCCVFGKDGKLLAKHRKVCIFLSHLERVIRKILLRKNNIYDMGLQTNYVHCILLFIINLFNCMFGILKLCALTYSV